MQAVKASARAGIAPAAALQRDAARTLAVVAAGLAVPATALASLLGPVYALKALALFGCGAVLAWRGLARAGAHPHACFGAANGVTALRLALAALLAAWLGDPMLQPPSAGGALAWGLVAVATLAALLDAVDGPLARRSGLASAYGARFDMETDAAFTLVLSALVWQTGQAGPWVLAAGLMRYAFVAAARVWPWLAGPLPPSRRRQAVCVLQITSLVVCLAPVVPAAAAGAVAAASLVLLAASFAVDVRRLARDHALALET